MMMTETNQLSDNDLIKAYRNGENAAFDSFIRRHQDTMFRLAYRRLYDTHQCNDAVQEVFFRACKNLRKWRPAGGSPFTWLYRTMTLVCMEMNRKVKRIGEHFAKLDDSAEWLARVAGPCNAPEGNIWTLQVLSELPDRQREIMVLHFFEDLTLKEIGKALNISTGSVKASYSKGLKKLRLRMSELDHGQGQGQRQRQGREKVFTGRVK